MELRRYLAIVRAHWVLAATAFAVTVLATLYLVMPQPWVYESSGSLLLRPSDKLRTQEDILRAWTNLSEPKIPNTYATLIQSELVVDAAELALPPAAETEGLTVDAEVLIDSTVIPITVTGRDPETVRDMVDAVMTEAITYAESVDETYQLERVEEPSLPGGPVGPNKNLQLILGILFGATLAIAVALFAEYIRRPVEDFAITDAATGASNELYLRHRLREETARTVRTSEPFTVATLRVEVRTGENDDMAHVPADRDLRRIARGLRLTLPDEAVLAYLGGGLFAGLIPSMTRDQVDGTVGGWAAAVGALLDWASGGEMGRRLQLSSGVCEFRGTQTQGSADVEKLVSRLIGEMSMDEEPGDTPAPSKRPGNGKRAPTRAPAEDRPETAPEAEAPAEDKAAAAAPAKAPAPAGAPAMPPAPVRSTAKPGNGGNRGKAGSGNGTPVKKIRRVTVIPEIDEMPGAGSRPTPGSGTPAAQAPGSGTPAAQAPGSGTPSKASGRDKGDAGDPSG